MNVIQETKAWGEVTHVVHDEAIVSFLKVVSGKSSIHYHDQKYNSFRVMAGLILVHEYYSRYADVGDTTPLAPGPNARPYITHRITNLDAEVIIRPRVWHQFVVVEPGLVVERYWGHSRIHINDIVRHAEEQKA